MYTYTCLHACMYVSINLSIHLSTCIYIYIYIYRPTFRLYTGKIEVDAFGNFCLRFYTE